MPMPQNPNSAGNIQFTDPRPPKPKEPPHNEASPVKEAGNSMQQSETQNRPIPTMGWPGTWYNVMKMFVESPTPLKLSKKELAFLEKEAAEAERIAEANAQQQERKHDRERGIQRVTELSDIVPALTVAFIGVKGAAGTTTTCANTSSVAGDLTRSTLVASDFNPASGTLAPRLGKDVGQTTTLRELLGDLDGFTNFKDFIRRVRPTRYSVRPISANDIVSDTEHLTKDDAARMLKVISDNSEYHFIDTANDITTAVTLAAVETTDVLVFTAYVGIHDSLRQLAVGMETLRQHGYEDKVKNSIVVISGVPDDVDPTIYRKYLNRVNIHNEVVQEYDFNGPFLCVPYDEVIRQDTQVDLEAIEWETYQAYLKLVILIFEQSPEYRRAIFHLEK